MSKQAQNEREALRNELQMKLEMIRKEEAKIPDMIADVVPTAPYRDKVRDFCEALDAYIESIGIDEVEKNSPVYARQAIDADSCIDCGDMDDERERVICQLEECYGLTGDWASFDLSQLTNLEMLRAILNAVEAIGRRIVEECGLELSFAQAFRLIFGTVDFRWNPNEREEGERTYATDSTTSEGLRIVELVPDAFTSDLNDRDRTDPASVRQRFNNIQESEDLIIHEIGHIFHNILAEEDVESTIQDEEIRATINEYSTYIEVIIHHVEFTIPGTDTREVRENLRIIVPRSMPRVLIDYLIETRGYFSGNLADVGRGRPEGNFTRGDVDRNIGVVLLTNLTFYGTGGQPIPRPPDGVCDDPFIAEYLVDEFGQPKLNDAGDCIPANINDSRAVFGRPSGSYFAGDYATGTNLGYFGNELQITSPSSNPREGFADTFKVFIRLGGEELPEDERRRIFFENNFCYWVTQLLSNGQ
jgi:hypothetical protein